MVDTRYASWKKPIRAAGLLVAGRSAQGILSLAFLALAVRTLGVEEFGILVLIHSLILAIAKTARFQTWQALIHYGAKAQTENDMPRLHRLLKFCFVLDALSAVLAFGIVILISGPAIRLLELDGSLRDTLRVYGIAILFMVMNGAPTGILQLFDRFDRIARQSTIAPLVRFVGTSYLFLAGGTLNDFLVLWFLAEVVGGVALAFLALKTLYAHDLLNELWKKSGSILKPAPGIWRYVGGTQIASTLDLTTTHLPVLLTGWLLGPAAAGIFRIAKQFAGIIMKPSTKLFGRAIYPDLARLSAQKARSERRQMMARTALFAGGLSTLVFLVLALFGKSLIHGIAGPDLTEAYAPMVWLALSGVIGALAFALEPLLIATGTIRQTVYIRLTATVVYIPAFYVLVLGLGLSGAGIAAVVNTALTALLMLWAGRDLLSSGEYA